MIRIFCAIFEEAAPLIDHYGLTMREGIPFRRFISEEKGMVIVISGVGKMRMAAAVAHEMALYGTNNDILINAGICGASSESGCRIGDVFLINKVTDRNSLREYYPDMWRDVRIPERGILCSATPVSTSEMPRDSLCDMESSGFMEGSFIYMGPHRVFLLKSVSDTGDTAGIDRTRIRKCMTGMIGYIDVITGKCASLPEKEDLVTGFPFDLFCCSEYMKHRVEELIVFARSEGLDPDGIINDMLSEGILPCKDKHEGVAAIEEMRNRIIG